MTKPPNGEEVVVVRLNQWIQVAGTRLDLQLEGSVLLHITEADDRHNTSIALQLQAHSKDQNLSSFELVSSCIALRRPGKLFLHRDESLFRSAEISLVHDQQCRFDEELCGLHLHRQNRRHEPTTQRSRAGS